ncbi:hypothetical protein GGS23DRAFT_240838 [Durotheca rogersii]|uniref:uncharacterized protein n=1 Tax=Durotheca rogersii TaxID=419775 RepID=UPI002221056A|nr:uncharacterized protein GGS23DRAFT_240838 [Durotheca rogersii]KAI5860240.1 hypothetical protein GGS23DRAFT_240838 [Durotheca rogersii]
MSSPSRPRPRQPQAPREYDDGAAAMYHSSSKPNISSGPPRFDSHDDFYQFLDNNRGPPPPHNASPSAAVPMPTQQPQRLMQPAGQPNQHIPAQSRPPLANTFPPQGSSGAPERSSRPPSYAGSSRSEEMLVAERNGESSKMQRQNGRRGTKPVSGPRPPSSSGGSPPRSSAGYALNHPQLQHAQAQAQAQANGKSGSPSDPNANLSIPGANVLGTSIQRLKSPSVLDCVLQPLDQKVREYAEIMTREQDEMDRLDAEIRALQERRADTEARYLDAKGKHDDYRQQYANVERAMRGELLPPITPREQPPPPQQQVPISRQPTRPMSFQEDDDDDDDDLPPPSSHRRISSQQSFGRTSQKMGKGRFRFSLFGDR